MVHNGFYIGLAFLGVGTAYMGYTYWLVKSRNALQSLMATISSEQDLPKP